MIQIPGHHAPSFQILSRQWVYYVARTLQRSHLQCSTKIYIVYKQKIRAGNLNILNSGLDWDLNLGSLDMLFIAQTRENQQDKVFYF